MQRRTKILIALIPATFTACLLDALEPGQGVFYNPLFGVRAQVAKLDTVWREEVSLNPADGRLNPCRQFVSETVVTAAQEEVRSILTGKSDSFALQQLGAPTCVLAEQTYRWLSESGLEIDVTVKEGVVTDAQLNR